MLPRGTPISRSLLSQLLIPNPLVSGSRYSCHGRLFSGQHAISTTSQSREDPLPIGTKIKGDSGRVYTIEEILADRRKPLLCVYRARANGGSFIIKNMIPGDFEYQLDLQKRLATCPNVRSVVDTVPDLELFIYPFLAGDLLRLTQTSLTREARVHILRCALHGLADMHERDVLHNGKSPNIKANNILVDYEESIQGQMAIKNVQISNLEDSAIVPPGKWLRGPLCGNAIWRSPESWCRSRRNQASDVFSYAIVMIYVMLNEMVFRVSDSQIHASDSWRYVLRRHVSYFANEEGFTGLLGHICADNPFHARLIELAGDFFEDNPRQPFGS
ncbi:kinase-like domain-containing protein [Aspergillus karnatakaensis]|uniref:kinase-like domain-containing protein n=1 Tax=Aspergillus karnatakaensis TaxID=1810916 RepID=UPI003CCE04B1